MIRDIGWPLVVVLIFHVVSAPPDLPKQSLNFRAEGHGALKLQAPQGAPAGASKKSSAFSIFIES